MLVVIIRRESAGRFFVSHFLGVEFFVVEKCDQFVLGQENVDQGYAQTNPRKWFGSVSDVVIEDDLASNSEYEGHIEQVESQVDEVAGDVAADGGSPQKVILVDPVVQDKSDSRNNAADRDEGHVEESEPDDLKHFSIPLADVIFWVLEHVVGFLLSVVLLAFVA